MTDSKVLSLHQYSIKEGILVHSGPKPLTHRRLHAKTLFTEQAPKRPSVQPLGAKNQSPERPGTHERRLPPVSCFYPLWAKPPAEGEDRKTLFARRWEPELRDEVHRAHDIGLMPIPCGKCYGCRSDQRQAWTIRCSHEASLYDNNTFLTLTVDEDHLPWHGSLNQKLLSAFCKRLRHEALRIHNPRYKNSRPNTLTLGGTTLRYFACGEYGTTTKRAHYHALLFGLWPQDATVYGADTFTSETLSQLWQEGSHQFSRVNPDRIAYTCGYTVKKMGTLRDRTAYGVVDPETGEYVEREPEFAVMSRRPGIGHGWFEKYQSDLRRGFLNHERTEVAIPRFYERKYQETHPEEVEYRKQLRARLRNQRDPIEATKQRLRTKEAVARARDRHYTPERFNEL